MTGQQKYHKLCMLRIKPKPTTTPTLTLTHTITPKHCYRTGNEELHTKKEQSKLMEILIAVIKHTDTSCKEKQETSHYGKL